MADFKTVGKATVDIDAFIAAARERTFIESSGLLEFACNNKFIVEKDFYANGKNFFFRSTSYSSDEERDTAIQEYREKEIDGAAKRLREIADYLTRFGLAFDFFQNLQVFETDEDRKLGQNDKPHNTVEMCVVGYGTSLFAVPTEFCEVQLFESREDVPLGELRKVIGSGGGKEDVALRSAGPQDHLTLRAAQSAREAAESQATALDEQIKSIQQGKHPEIQELHRQMEEARKKFELMVAELSGNMVAQKSTLMLDIAAKMNTIEALDAMLYTVQCFEGEVVDFVCVTDGPAAPRDEPLVIYQTLRYLDEELGRHCSIYNLDFSGVSLFEDLLAARKDVVEVFCPNPKSICFIGNSSTRSKYSVVDSVQGIFEKYEKYHSKTIGILIRNGDRLFFGWTSEERVNVRDGKMFYSAGVTVHAAEDVKKNPWELDGEWTEDPWKLPKWFQDKENVSYDDQKAIKYDPDEEQRLHSFENYRQITASKIFKEIHTSQKVSRMFAFSIIEGILKRGDMMQLPEGERVSDALKGKPSKHILFSMADAWLPENTYPSFNEYIEKFCSSDKAGDPILVMLGVADGLFDSQARTYRYNRSVDGLGRTRDASVDGTTVQAINLIQEGSVYVSAEKEYSMKGARANIRLYSSEYINITFMNSVWLEYVLRTRSASGVRVGNATFAFSDMIPYIKTAKQWLESREAVASQHLATIAPEILEDEDWPIKMSMWMFDSNVRLHTVTEYQARRFAKYYHSTRSSRG